MVGIIQLFALTILCQSAASQIVTISGQTCASNCSAKASNGYTPTCKTESGTGTCATLTSDTCSGATQNGQQCIWPYSWKGKTYTTGQCSYADTKSNCPWCATKPVTNDKYSPTASSTSNWDNCNCCGMPTSTTTATTTTTSTTTVTTTTTMTTTTTATITAVICENDATTITCNSGTINILSATYGRSVSNICPGSYDVDSDPIRAPDPPCSSDVSHTPTITACQGQDKCSFTACDSDFEDPCFGTYKYLTLSYECIAGFKSGKDCKEQWYKTTKVPSFHGCKAFCLSFTKCAAFTYYPRGVDGINCGIYRSCTEIDCHPPSRCKLGYNTTNIATTTTTSTTTTLTTSTHSVVPVMSPNQPVPGDV